MPNLTDISYIKKLCTENGFELSKNFGQNFIINAGICPKIVEASGITEEYGVLEIGPGIGVLTKELALRAKKVVAVEIDERLPAILAKTLSEFENVKIITGDVLKLDLAALISEEFDDMPVAVCANLPYYITSPIIMALLEQRLPIRHITVMVQKEAADRICATPATRA
ncbi:MAG: rRNA adenine dimethyltransferase family protein, partial [Oscillospiraceae bacterium]